MTTSVTTCQTGGCSRSDRESLCFCSNAGAIKCHISTERETEDGVTAGSYTLLPRLGKLDCFTGAPAERKDRSGCWTGTLKMHDDNNVDASPFSDQSGVA